MSIFEFAEEDLILNIHEPQHIPIINSIRHAIICSMNAEEIRFHLRDRWKAVEEIERQELRASTVKENWERLNAIMLRAKLLNLSRGQDNNEMEVFLRWAKLREKYEASKRTTKVS